MYRSKCLLGDASTKQLIEFLSKPIQKMGAQLNNFKVDPNPEGEKYHAATFSILGNSSTTSTTNIKKVIFRQANITPDRPGAFLSLWKRPPESSVHNKPIPLTPEELNFVVVAVHSPTLLNEATNSVINPLAGFFIFPAALLINQGIITSLKYRGKTGFRVFPPWSQHQEEKGTKVLSASGKKTQGWQLPYFIEVKESGNIDVNLLASLLNVQLN